MLDKLTDAELIRLYKRAYSHMEKVTDARDWATLWATSPTWYRTLEKICKEAARRCKTNLWQSVMARVL